ncbi:MAG: TetR/AcrR family transcriptional regulator [Nitrospinae bacterium]|nr:TetR/AcrR family transcriptional regulator [Nitrospinota bacterium]
MAGKPAKAGEASRARIISAAMAIIGRRGVSGLTTALIARQSRMSEANLYRHFKGKDDILRATLEKVWRDIMGNLSKAAEEARPPSEALKLFIQRHFEYVEKNRAVPKIIFSDEIHVLNAGLRRALNANMGKVSWAMGQIIREGQEKGEFRDDVRAEELAMMFIGLGQSVALRWSLGGRRESIREMGLSMWRNYEKLVCVPGAGKS